MKGSMWQRTFAGKLPWVLIIFLSCLGMAGPVAARESVAPPPHPRLLQPSLAPRTARLLPQVALAYAPGMTLQARERDFLQKVSLAKKLLGVGRLVELRHQTLNLLPPGREVSWEDLRLRRWPQGDRVGATLLVPVWVPARAQKLQTYCGFAKKWQTVAAAAPRPCGYVWHVGTLRDINDKTHYRAEWMQVEVNSKFAPLAALLLEYIFREGWYDPSRRVPLLVLRGGEDTFAVSAASGPVAAECLSFPDDDGSSLAASVVLCRYDSLAAIYHGHHSVTSNHRLGLALDLNDYNFKGVVDGVPNPISRATRQYDRAAMHRLDARQMPAWVYRAAKWLGMRLPQEWIYEGYHTDWEHVDVGTK
jgi:hypothetical protein